MAWYIINNILALNGTGEGKRSKEIVMDRNWVVKMIEMTTCLGFVTFYHIKKRNTFTDAKDYSNQGPAKAKILPRNTFGFLQH